MEGSVKNLYRIEQGNIHLRKKVEILTLPSFIRMSSFSSLPLTFCETNSKI